jgi:hypothetical protein
MATPIHLELLTAFFNKIGPSRHFAAMPHSRLQATAFVLSLIARRLDYLHENLLARRLPSERSNGDESVD